MHFLFLSGTVSININISIAAKFGTRKLRELRRKPPLNHSELDFCLSVGQQLLSTSHTDPPNNLDIKRRDSDDDVVKCCRNSQP